jgi:8-oxo-dGTP diphosphatase
MPRTNTRVTAVFKNKDQALLIHRFKNGNEYWVAVGGGMEDGETEEEALVREVLEETSLKITDFKKVKTLKAEFDDLYPVYLCQTDSYAKISLGGPEKEKYSENNQYIPTWVNINSLPDKIYPEGIREIIQSLK